MFGIRPQRREPSRPVRARAARPTFDALEARVLLYTTTGGWSYPIRVTYSIVPDGTSIGGTPSSWFQAMSSQGIATATWQQLIQKAAAIWQAVAGVNLVQVSDNGAPIGSSGNQQDDPGFGDIRIGGMPQSGSYLGFAYAPPKPNGGTNAGDILLNTAQSWHTDGTNYDLLTVLVHEFGHALGMGHSSIATADMYANYLGQNQALSSDDIQGIQSIYGAFQFGTSSNNSYPSATHITPDGNGQISLANLAINSSSDADWYYLTVPDSTTGTMTMTIRVQSSNLSSLSPQIQVYTASLGSVGGVVSAPYSYGSTVGESLGGVATGQGYYIKVTAANKGPSGNGNYGLQVNFGSSSQSAIAPPDTVVTAQPDQSPSSTGMGTGWMVGDQFIPYLGVLDALQGIDLRLMSWGDGSGVPTSGNSLVIVGTDNNGLLHIRIFDAIGDRVTDTDETKLPITQALAISTLKLQLPGLLPPHVLTDAENAQVLDEVRSILNITNGLYCITYGTLSGFGQPELAAGELAGPGRPPGGGRGVGGTHDGGQRWHRDAPAPFGMSDTIVIPPAVGTGAAPGQGGLQASFPHRRGGPGRAGVTTRLRAVDAALSGWQPDGRTALSRPFVGGHPGRSFRTALAHIAAARSPTFGP